MIDDKVYKEVLERGLILDHYLLLCNIQAGKKVIESRRIQGFIALLEKKGYLQEGALTEKAVLLIQECDVAKALSFPSRTEEVEVPDTPFRLWVGEVYKDLQNILIQHTGKKQYSAKVNGKGKGWLWLPGPVDLHNTLQRFFAKYNLKEKDRERVGKALTRYTLRCAVNNDWFPILKYYILKEGSSPLSADLETIDEEDEEQTGYTSNQKFV